MIDYKKFAAALAQCETAAQSGTLTARAMENAMVNLDRIAPSFGPSSHDYRQVDSVSGTDNTMKPVTTEQFAAYLAAKQTMLTDHSYVLER